MGKRPRRVIPLLLLMFALSLVLSSCAYSVTVHPEASNSVLVNPMTGYAPWATNQEIISDEQTLVYVDLTWRDWEPSPDVYNYEAFEKDKNLSRWRSEGKRVVFRFLCDVPGDEKHMDIPDWLYDLTGGNGNWYDTEYGKGYAPDYSDPVLIERHQIAVEALADRYGKDDFFCFIELGSLGHWGEWHVKYDSGIKKMPKAAIRDQYVRHYLDAFQNSFLLMRRPFAVAASEGLGLYNDMTGHKEDTEEWLGWIINGGDYRQASEGEGALLPMPEGWKIAPVGGEFTGSIPMTDMVGRGLNTTLDLLKRSHTSFIGPKTPLESSNQQTFEYQPGSEQILKTVGYRLRIEAALFSISPFQKNNLKITLKWVNDGIAPMYYPWDTFLYLIDQNNNLVKNQQVKIDVTEVVPGKTVTSQTNINISELQLDKSTFKIGLAILDPMTKKPGIAFAMENSRDDRIYILGSFQFK